MALPLIKPMVSQGQELCVNSSLCPCLLEPSLFSINICSTSELTNSKMNMHQMGLNLAAYYRKLQYDSNIKKIKVLK